MKLLLKALPPCYSPFPKAADEPRFHSPTELRRGSSVPALYCLGPSCFFPPLPSGERAGVRGGLDRPPLMGFRPCYRRPSCEGLSLSRAVLEGPYHEGPARGLKFKKLKGEASYDF